MIRTAVALALLAATAHAQPTPVLGPGQEGAVLDLLRVDLCALQGVQIDRDRIHAEYRCDGPEHDVVLRHPSSSDSPYRTERFAIETDAPRELVESLLTSIRRGEARVRWSEPTPHVAGRAQRVWVPPLTWALMALLLLVVVRELRWPSRVHASLVVIALAMLVVPDWGPLHEHLTFTARADCALVGCDRERPGWLAPTYHAYRVLLQLVPYTSKGLSLLSAGLMLVALAAQLAWLRLAAPRVALVAILLCGLHPITLRASVAHSFWPLALAYLWLGAWLGEKDGLAPRIGAVCAWALAATSSVAMVLPVAVFCLKSRWPRESGAAEGAKDSDEAFAARMAWDGRKHAWLLLVPVAFASLHLAPFVAELGTGNLAVRLYPSHFVDHALFDPRVSPFGFTLLVAAGAFLARRARWALAPALAIVVALPALGEPLETGFPVALLHGLPLVALAAPLAALAWTSTPAKLRALPIALVVLSAPTAIEIWRLDLQPVAHEQAAIERLLPTLPAHSRLVIAPEIAEPMGERWDGDPIEVRFPVGFYRAHGFDAEIVHLDEFLESPGGDALVYVGTSLVSFHPSEINDDVRTDPRRPLLRRLATLEPVATFELSTQSHPWVLMRVAADTAPNVELGFYRITR